MPQLALGGSSSVTFLSPLTYIDVLAVSTSSDQELLVVEVSQTYNNHPVTITFPCTLSSSSSSSSS